MVSWDLKWPEVLICFSTSLFPKLSTFPPPPPKNPQHGHIYAGPRNVIPCCCQFGHIFDRLKTHEFSQFLLPFFFCQSRHILIRHGCQLAPDYVVSMVTFPLPRRTDDGRMSISMVSLYRQSFPQHERSGSGS